MTKVSVQRILFWSVTAAVFLCLHDLHSFASTFALANPNHARNLGRGTNTATQRHVVETPTMDVELRRNIAVGESFDDILHPPELMWERPHPDLLVDKYLGSSSFAIQAWSVIVPLGSFVFLMLGLSLYLKYDLVDLNPVASEYLFFLHTNALMSWIPQGIFMTLWGSLGAFVVTPLLWFFAATNMGAGAVTFDRREKKMTIMRDREIQREVKFAEIERVKMTWNTVNMLFGVRTITLLLRDGTEVDFLPNNEDYPQRVLEKRATILANFLDKPLDIDQK